MINIYNKAIETNPSAKWLHVISRNGNFLNQTYHRIRLEPGMDSAVYHMAFLSVESAEAFLRFAALMVSESENQKNADGSWETSIEIPITASELQEWLMTCRVA